MTRSVVVRSSAAPAQLAVLDLVETDERAGSLGRRVLRRRAVKLAERYPPIIPSYRLVIERVKPLLWEVVAYQNVARSRT